MELDGRQQQQQQRRRRRCSVVCYLLVRLVTTSAGCRRMKNIAPNLSDALWSARFMSASESSSQ
jgi:hypothetical protein